jgi:hypothetical protein
MKAELPEKAALGGIQPRFANGDKYSRKSKICTFASGKLTKGDTLLGCWWLGQLHQNSVFPLSMSSQEGPR